MRAFRRRRSRCAWMATAAWRPSPFSGPGAQEDPRWGSAWRSRMGAVGPACAAASARARGPWNKWGDPRSGGYRLCRESPLLAQAGAVVQVQGLDAAIRLRQAPPIARKDRQAPRGRAGAPKGDPEGDATRRPPQSRRRPSTLRPRPTPQASPRPVGDGSIHPQGRGKRWAKGGRPCRLQLVPVLSTGRGQRPAAPGGSIRPVSGARWARRGRDAPPLVGAAGDGEPRSSTLASPWLAADQGTPIWHRRPIGWPAIRPCPALPAEVSTEVAGLVRSGLFFARAVMSLGGHDQRNIALRIADLDGLPALGL